LYSPFERGSEEVRLYWHAGWHVQSHPPDETSRRRSALHRIDEGG
jgi:hypothetical protein